MKTVPIILSGGSGTRLWPLSRRDYPKQYLPLLGENTLLQETLLRLNGIENITTAIVVCNVEQRFLVAQQCQTIDQSVDILLEPIGRNTAPAIAAGALYALKKYANEAVTLLVLSADHAIADIDAFHQAITLAIQEANKGRLLTFGIVPTEANTHYGYIKANITHSSLSYPVTAFVEKPNLSTAEQYISAGGYFWNSGMFVFEPTVLLAELSQYAPDIVDCATQSVVNADKDFGFIYLEPQAFAKSPNSSIDYVLMEKSDKVSVVPLEAGWSDVGVWSALYDIDTQNEDNNVIKGEIVTQDTHNSYISAHHLVVTIGVDNLIIINTPDATLVANKDEASKVGDIVQILKNKQKIQTEAHRKVYRPWGWYDIIETGDFFQVKRLHIIPKAKLSLQSHQQRDEHWVVVKGVASVVNGGEKFALKQGQSTYIPRKTKHSLANQTNEELEIIEVQSGNYLGEDDIKRFEDFYGRVKK